MRKKVGEISVINSSSIFPYHLKKYKINIWGDIYKSNDGTLLGGVHFNISPSIIEDMYPFVQQLLEVCGGYRFKEINDQFGHRFRVSYFGALKDFDANAIVETLNEVPEYEDDENRISITISKNYDFVLESKVIKDL